MAAAVAVAAVLLAPVVIAQSQPEVTAIPAIVAPASAPADPASAAPQPVPHPAPSAATASSAAAHPAIVAQAAARASAPRAVASGAKANGKAVVTGPLWRELNPGQHQALAPLAGTWNTLNEAQKRKWLALSASYPKLAATEQQKLHSRMVEWVALSPQQRAQARLNFGETQKIAPDEKKAKWEAYQALSPEEKRKLAAGATKPPSTAAAVKPVAPEKLATVPKPHARPDTKTPRIAASPELVDVHTLLPQPSQPQQAPPPPQAPPPAQQQPPANVGGPN
ncbi:hypothetical protein GCM10027034_03110 [Ramlibacter solisilvae]